MESTPVQNDNYYMTERTRYNVMYTQLFNDRASFISHWRECTDFIVPRRGRFWITDVNRGDRRNGNIIDTTPTLSLRTLKSGMMSGVSSPARPWFRLTVSDPELAEDEEVKDWLHEVSDRMSRIFLRSNLYNVLPIVYGDMGALGTAAMMIEEDFKNVIRFYVFPVGSYMIAQDENYKVNVFMREFQMTVRQLIDKFGKKKNGMPDVDAPDFWDNFSVTVKDLYEKNQWETWIQVVHVIEPNRQHDGRKFESKFKKFKSVYYERATASQYSMDANDALEKFLSEKGYDYFPVLAPRWEVTGEDVYGTSCPGMDSLGDNKTLQLMEKRGMQAIEKMVNPPLMGPPNLKNQKASVLPGDVTYVDAREGQQGFKPVYQVEPKIAELEAKEEQIRQRIKSAFFVDLFLMLISDDRLQPPTATEVNEKHEEKMLALGPVLEQLNQDLFDPLIEITFDIMTRQRLLPPAPSKLKGQNLNVEYISIMAQAQKLVGVGSMQQLWQLVQQIATVDPNILDKIDLDEFLTTYADLLGAPNKVLRTEDAVAAIRQAKAKQAADQQQADNMEKTASTAKQLSMADLNGNNALSRLVQSMGSGAPGAPTPGPQ